MSNALELPPLVDLVAFPGWLKDVRARMKGALSVAHIDAGRNGKAEPHIQRWLAWDSTVLTSTTRRRGTRRRAWSIGRTRHRPNSMFPSCSLQTRNVSRVNS